MELVIKKFNELTIEELHEILKVRVAVFVVEQNCPYQEVDDKDKYSYHVYFRDENGIQAYLRVIEKNNLLLIELENYDNFKKKVWISYFSEIKNDAKKLTNFYKSEKG